MFRLVRGTRHILDVLDGLHRDQVALRIHDAAFSAMDLNARHPRTGKLLSTVKFMVQTRAAAGELQRELTYDGLRAAEAKGSRGGPHRRCGRQDRGRARPVPGRPLDRGPRPRPRRQPRRHPYVRRRPHARPHGRRPGRHRPGAAGCPRHAGQGCRLPPHDRAAARRAGSARPRGDRTPWPRLHPARHRRPGRAPPTPRPPDGGPGASAVPAQRKARREYENRVSTLTQRP